MAPRQPVIMWRAGLLFLLTCFSSACLVFKHGVVCEVQVYEEEDCYNGSWIQTCRSNHRGHDGFSARPLYFDIENVFFTPENGPYLNISISLPATEDNVSGFVVLMTDHIKMRCFVFNLSKPVDSNEMVNITSTIGPVSPKNNLYLQAYNLPISRNKINKTRYFQDLYVNTAYAVKDTDPSSYWRTSIIYKVDSIEQSVWVHFVDAPKRYELGENYVIRLLRSTHAEVYQSSTVKQGNFHTFQNVTPGEYFLQVYPQKMCKDESDGFEWESVCIRPRSSHFTITGPIALKLQKTTAFMDSDEYMMSTDSAIWYKYDASQPVVRLMTYPEAIPTSEQTTLVHEITMDKTTMITIVTSAVVSVLLLAVFAVTVLVVTKKAKLKRKGYSAGKLSNVNPCIKDKQRTFSYGVNGHEQETMPADKEYQIFQQNCINELSNKNVIQTGNFLIDFDDVSVISPSIYPAVTLLEVNLEDDIQFTAGKEASLKSNAVDDTCVLGHWKSKKVPEDFSFISPDIFNSDEVSDDVTSEFQSEQISAVNRRYFEYLQHQNETENHAVEIDSQKKYAIDDGSMRDDERKCNIIKSTRKLVNSATNKDTCTCSEEGFDSGFCNSSDSRESNTFREETSLGGISI